MPATDGRPAMSKSAKIMARFIMIPPLLSPGITASLRGSSRGRVREPMNVSPAPALGTCRISTGTRSQLIPERDATWGRREPPCPTSPAGLFWGFAASRTELDNLEVRAQIEIAGYDLRVVSTRGSGVGLCALPVFPLTDVEFRKNRVADPMEGFGNHS